MKKEQSEQEPQNPALRVGDVVDSVTSIWDTMSNSELESKLIEIENDIESLNTSKRRIENVLFYRKNLECR